MKSELSWLVEGRVLKWRMSGNIPQSGMCGVLAKITQYMNAGNHGRVHLVIDGRGLQKIAHQSHEVRVAFNAMAQNIHIGKIAVITQDIAVQIQFNALNRDFGLNWRYVHSLDQAERFLRNTDTLVPRFPSPTPDEMPKRGIRRKRVG